MISSYQLQRLIDLPVEGVAERLGLRVKRHVSLCPFHEDKRPSLHFNPAKNRYRCYVCGAYGRTIDLVMHHLNLSFVEACRWLADDSNIILDEYKAKVKKEPEQAAVNIDSLLQLVANPVLTDEAKRFLFDERKLDPRVIQWCGISSTHSDLIIPYFGIDNKLIGIQWRNLEPRNSETLEPWDPETLKPSKPRFRFPKGSQCSIYNLQILKLLKPYEPLWITEGCSDCWAMLSSGRKAIAIPSATLLKPEDLKPLELWNVEHGTSLNLHMFPDNDAPGEKLFLQLREQLPHIERHQLPAGCKDFSDFYLETLKP